MATETELLTDNELDDLELGKRLTEGLRAGFERQKDEAIAFVRSVGALVVPDTVEACRRLRRSGVPDKDLVVLIARAREEECVWVPVVVRESSAFLNDIQTLADAQWAQEQKYPVRSWLGEQRTARSGAGQPHRL